MRHQEEAGDFTPQGYEQLVERSRGEPRRLVQVERRGDHAVVTMDDPPSLNALSAVLTVQLHDALRELVADPKLRAIVLTGSDPGFSAGGDLNLMADAAHPMLDHGGEGAADLWRWIRHQFGGIVRLIMRSDTPFIAALNGAAAGVGLAFALSCDLVVASEQARIVPAFLRIGLLPEVGTSWALTRRLGYQRTFELFAHGRIIGAAEALQLGLVNELVPHAELTIAAERWCERIARQPRHAMQMMKPLLRHAADLTWDQALAMEEFAEPNCFSTAAHRRAVHALLGQGTAPTG
ncbi:MAG: enoyl-CoA hydratase/isomerase family protein [Nevskia sp.]|nr:enoyl-CoA hydratase/isomerase family protein [Nevskia sp.]